MKTTTIVVPSMYGPWYSPAVYIRTDWPDGSYKIVNQRTGKLLVAVTQR